MLESRLESAMAKAREEGYEVDEEEDGDDYEGDDADDDGQEK